MTDKSYTVDEIVNNVAKVRFSNGEWTFIELESDMTEADFDDTVHKRMPASLAGGDGTPSFLSEGASRTAAEKPEPAEQPLTYEQKRQVEYGTAEQQLEYITENGLSAWQTKVATIKAKYPKPSED